MAKIPSLGGSNRVRSSDPLAPSLSPRDAAAPFKQAGDLAGKVGQGLTNLRNKQVAEANKVSYVKSNIAFSESFNQISSDLEGEFRETRPDHEGYAEEGIKRLADRKDEILDEVPESARNSVSLSFDQSMSKYGERLKSQESSRKSQYATTETEGMIDDASDGSYSNYSPMDTLEHTRRLQGLVGGSSKFDGRGKQVLNNRIDKVNSNMLKGVIDREDPAEMRRALSDLQSEDMKPVFGSMDPEMITKTVAKLSKKINYQNSEAKSNILKSKNDAISAFKAGLIGTSPKEVKMIENLKTKIQAALGDDAASVIDEIETHQAINEHMSENAFGEIDSDALSTEISSGSKDELSRLGSKAKSSRVIEVAERNRKKAMEADFASYASKHDSSVSINSKAMISMAGDPVKRQKAANKYFNTIDSRAKQAGIPANKITYLDDNLKNQYKGIGEALNSGSPEMAAAMIADFDQAVGGRGYKLMDELDIPKDVAIVSEVMDPQDQANVLKSINNPELDETYKNVAIRRGLKDTKVRQELMDRDLMKGVSLEDGGTQAGAIHTNAMFNTVHREYKRLITSNPNISHEDAKKSAWGIFEKRYDTLEQNGDRIPIPKKFNSDNAQNFLDKYNGSADYVKDFDLKLTPKKNGVSTTVDEMNGGLADNARWVFNRKQGGLILMARQGDSKYRFVPNKDGKPVIKTFEEIDAFDYADSLKRKQTNDFIKIMGQRGRDL